MRVTGSVYACGRCDTGTVRGVDPDAAEGGGVSERPWLGARVYAFLFRFLGPAQLGPQEQPLCFFSVGTVTRGKSARPRPKPADYSSEL